VSYREIPACLVAAPLAAEVKRFWGHPGEDWRAYTRAAWGWLRHRHVVSGGSTITLQLVKLAQPRPRNLRSKIIEAAQALRLEQLWPKERILT
jgi:penicillin-binding protein 1C